MSKMRVVVDTNIFITYWFGKRDKSIEAVMKTINNRETTLLFSQLTIGELYYVAKNFARKNIDSAKDIITFLNGITTMFFYGISINTQDTECPHINDINDNMFLECAIKGNSDFLISNDLKSGMHEVKNLTCKVVSSNEFMSLYKQYQETARTIE